MDPQSLSAIPLIISLRIASMVRIAGVAHGIRLDAAYGAELSLTESDEHGSQWLASLRGDESAYRKISKLARDELDFDLSIALARHVRDQQPKCFYLETMPPDKFCEPLALRCCQSKAIPLMFCATHDDRVWWAMDRLDERYLNFDSEADARLAFRDMAAEAIAGMACRDKPRLDIRFDSKTPLRLDFESNARSAPCNPKAPFTAIHGGHPTGYESIWSNLCAARTAFAEKSRIDGAIVTPESEMGARGAPKMGPRL